MAEKFQEPALGRHVIYVLGEGSPKRGELRSAVVALVHDVKESDSEANPGLSNLSVFIGTEVDFPNQKAAPGNAVWLIKSVKYDASKKPGTWHWPELVQPAAPKPAAGKTGGPNSPPSEK